MRLDLCAYGGKARARSRNEHLFGMGSGSKEHIVAGLGFFLYSYSGYLAYDERPHLHVRYHIPEPVSALVSTYKTRYPPKSEKGTKGTRIFQNTAQVNLPSEQSSQVIKTTTETATSQVNHRK